VSSSRELGRQLDRVTTEPQAWDATVIAEGGHLLQSWRWGALKEQFGWRVERFVAAGNEGLALAQVLFRHRMGLSIGYIPRGPMLSANDPTASELLWRQIDHAARARRCVTIIIEPNVPLPSTILDRQKLVEGPHPIQPTRSVKVDLADDESLLAQMHQKTRYNVRLAQRRGVVTNIAEPNEASLNQFYLLLRDTSARNEFDIHSTEYYREFMRQFGKNAVLLFAEIEGKPVATAIAVAFGAEAIYMYGASSTRDRAHGAGFLVQYEAMRWAREHGCKQYDLWGIPAEEPKSTKVDDGDRIAGTSGGDWRGLYEFKTRFGGTIIRYPPPVERRYLPFLASTAQRFYRSGT
jgi:lipid II:glycine glycyltransferase (peptidoglycan interpeptide bridge formation enzyme)